MYYVFVGPELETKVFQSYELGRKYCLFNPGWSFAGEMEPMFQ